MAVIERQSQLSEEISTADSRPAWLLAVHKVAKQFGFAHVSLIISPTVNDLLLAPLVVESTISARFVREIDAHHFLPLCPDIPRLNRSLLPQFWSVHDSVPPFPDEMRRIMTDYGIACGVMIPINAPSGERYIIRFDGDTTQPCQSVMNALGMIGLHAYDVYDSMKRNEMAPVRTLTKRELEVIRWTAQGKTSAEIGQILSLSDHTINAYMNNAIKKLDCVNRTQLVAKAIRSKLIS
ncbi:LuxR C-terminal-related transcriptional regulator [Agrobacterium sp.]|uniref:helix-turn-helix transcriptional regulator n=1 Tax=Agrobacterium sp. TaxID=361 RepID=UPI0028A64C09